VDLGVGECFFRHWLTRVIPGQNLESHKMVVCVCVYIRQSMTV